ncbi:MAG TPA: cytochrome c [Steroidobacteraceae bacterium]
MHLRRVGAGLGALACACLAAAVALSDSPSVTSSAISSVGGMQVYQHLCQGCHMADAQGAVGAGHYPKLAGNPALRSWQYVALTVLNGKNGMPAFGVRLSKAADFGSIALDDARVAEVVNYVRSHFGNRWQDKATATEVAALPHPP